MKCISGTADVVRSAALLLMGLGTATCLPPAHAQPIPLPYQADAPYLPFIDLFGSPEQGLTLSAVEAISGRPAPVTIGNATFVPWYTEAGKDYGGYTRFEGDLQIVGGDLYLGRQPVGQSLQQLRNDYSAQQVQLQQQGSSIDQLKVESASNGEATRKLGTTVNQQGQVLEQVRTEQAGQQVQLQQHAESINTLGVRTVRMGQDMEVLGSAVNSLNQTAANHAATLQDHAVAINSLATEVGHSKQAIATLDRNLTRLGSGVSGATALAAALGSLPAESQDSPIACGLGTGGYSSRYALAMGCAVRLSSAVSLNGGGSYLFGGSTDYGNGVLSNVAGRIGLVYRFGATGDGKAIATAADRQLNQQLQSQLQQAEQRQQAMAAALDALQQRLRSLETLARRR